jgi:hypothetical protein
MRVVEVLCHLVDNLTRWFAPENDNLLVGTALQMK